MPLDGSLLVSQGQDHPPSTSAMEESSLESADGVAVASKEDMSLFDEEILFDKDPNKAYFQYLVAGFGKGKGNDDDDIDDSLLTGDSPLEHLRDFSTPVDVQKRWIKMACDAMAEDTIDGTDDSTLDNGSIIPRGLDSLPPGVFDGVEVQEAKTSTDASISRFPPIVYLEHAVRAVGAETEQKDERARALPEHAPEQAPALSSPPATKKTFFRHNRRLILAILVFFFLSTVGLGVAFLAFSQRQSENDDGSSTKKGDPTSGSAPGASGDRGEDGSPQDSPTTSSSGIPSENPPKEEPIMTFTPSPSTVSATSEPTLSPATSPPTAEPTMTPTIHPTALPTVSPTQPPTLSPSQSPSAPPTDSLPFVLEELIAMLSSVSPDGGAALSNRRSFQFFAAQWLSRESGYGFYSDQTKIQRYVLATLFLSTSGYQWTNAEKWMTESDECDWFNDRNNNGRCDNGEIEMLYLPYNSLMGSLPAELALLSNSLIRLYLPGNKLNGKLPTELGLMTNLKWLSLKQNRNLVGTLPTELGLMSELTLLDVGEMGLRGWLPSEIGMLTKLHTLWVESNSLRGTVPSALALARNLEYISLNANRFDGSIPPELLELPELQVLSIDDNRFTGVVSVDNIECFELELRADCDEVRCDCCTQCCYDGIGCTDM